jgi:hypothetical protein
MNWERRLPPVAENALDILRETVKDNDDGLSKDEATAMLVADDRFTEGNAEYALDMLESRRHIYHVNEQAYITPTDD